jgi:alpha-mannosidase
MMNLTGNDHQFGQAGQREWTFRYRLVLADGPWDPVRPFQEAQRFGTPPFLQVPGHAPVVPGLESLGVAFSGGPLTAAKVAEDGKRLVLRVWNVLDRPADVSFKLPDGSTRAEVCDALERPVSPLTTTSGHVNWPVPPCGIATIAVCWEP